MAVIGLELLITLALSHRAMVSKSFATKVCARVTLPVCLPAILDLPIHLFVKAMTHRFGGGLSYPPSTTLATRGAEHGRRRPIAPRRRWA
ncbi:MAG: hypothetical protein ACREH3_04305 [Geminicoccales bacterium]